MSTVYRNEVLADSPTHYWPLETNGDDIAGTADGTAVGAVFGADVPSGSIFDGSAVFDGVDDHFTTTVQGPQHDTFTVEYWVSHEQAAATVGRVVGTGPFDDGWAFGVRNTDSGARFGPILTTYGLLDYDTRSGRLFAANGQVPANDWTHIVFVHNAHPGKVVLYLDGKFVDDMDTVSGSVRLPGDLTLGVSTPSGSDWYQGKTCHVAYFASAVSAARIQAHYDAAFAAGPLLRTTGGYLRTPNGILRPA